jgi:hypothetical protein
MGWTSRVVGTVVATTLLSICTTARRAMRETHPTYAVALSTSLCVALPSWACEAARVNAGFVYWSAVARATVHHTPWCLGYACADVLSDPSSAAKWACEVLVVNAVWWVGVDAVARRWRRRRRRRQRHKHA